MNLAANDPHDYRSTVCLLVADAEDDPSAYRESLWLEGCEVVDAAGGRHALVKATDTNSRCNEPTQKGRISRKGQGC